MYIYFCLAISLEQAVAPANPFIHRKKSTQIQRLSFLKNNDFLSITPSRDLLIENPTF